MSATTTANEAIMERLGEMVQFHPANVSLLEGWMLDPGDIVTVKSDNVSYKVPIFRMNVDWKGDSQVGIESTGSEKRPPLSELKRRSYSSSKREEDTEQELSRHRADIEQSNERILLWATDEEWDKIAQEWQMSQRSQFALTSDSITSLVQQTGVTAGVATFDPTHSYSANDKCIYNGVVYRFTSAHSGAWTGNDVVAVTSMQSQITQQANKISLVVTESGGQNVINRAAIVLAINNGSSSARIDANQIQLNGDVTLNGALNITNGELTSSYPISTTDYLKGGSLTLSDGTAYGVIAATDISKFAKSMSLTYDSSTSLYTLSWTDGMGTHAENFSRAAATTKVSGAWSSGVYVVSADPNGQNLPLSLAVTNTVGAISNTIYSATDSKWYGDVSVTPSVGGAAGSSATYQIDVQDAVNAGVGAGWHDAAVAVGWPHALSSASALQNTMTVTVPDETWNTTDSRTFRIDLGDGPVWKDSSSGVAPSGIPLANTDFNRMLNQHLSGRGYLEFYAEICNNADSSLNYSRRKYYLTIGSA